MRRGRGARFSKRIETDGKASPGTLQQIMP